MANTQAAIGGKHKTTPFKLRCNITPRGVFFDRVDSETGDRRLMILTTERKARRLAQWILENTNDAHDDE